jgi:hypothetical protein
MYLDACCYHAALATVLEWYGAPDPRLVLGDGASSNATISGETLRFRDSFAALADMCHYWIDYKRTHTHHAVVLWALDRRAEAVLISDPSDIVAFEGWRSVAELRDAASAEDRGQAWLDIRPQPTEEWPLARRLARLRDVHAPALVEDFECVCCLRLARYVRSGIDGYLEFSLRLNEPDAQSGADERRRANSHFLRGLWNFNHTLRWFSSYLNAVGQEAGRAAIVGASAPVLVLAQRWLLLRNLIMKFGLSPEGRRADVARRCCEVLFGIESAAVDAHRRLAAALA